MFYFRLKIQEVEAMENLYHFKHERLQRRDLMRLTWTTKHRWFPSHEHRYEDARKNPRERPYL
jgi:large subunit ribosomal protein L42